MISFYFVHFLSLLTLMLWTENYPRKYLVHQISGKNKGFSKTVLPAVTHFFLTLKYLTFCVQWTSPSLDANSGLTWCRFILARPRPPESVSQVLVIGWNSSQSSWWMQSWNQFVNFCWKNSFPQAVLPLFVLSIEAWTEFSSCLVSGLQLQNIYEGLILSPCSCQYRIRCNWFRSWPLPLLEANVTASLMEAKDRRRRGVTSHEKCCNES